MTKKQKSERQNAEGMQPEIWAVTSVYMEALDCPRALTVYLLCKYGEWMQVAQLKATPKEYQLHADYHLAALATDWLRKWPDLPVKVDRETATKDSWYQSEEECCLTNQRLALLTEGHHSGPSSEGKRMLNLLLDVAADFIRDVLGPCPKDLTPAFGPGATMSDPVTNTTVLDKVTSRPTVTSSALCLLPLWQDTAWARALTRSDGYYKSAGRLKIVEGNSFFMVNKTALVNRACAKGPSMNVAYQLPVGRKIRERLHTALGLDLVNGQERHQKLAKIGSLSGAYATVDSERASDTQAKYLVYRLYKEADAWYDLLDTLREPSTYIDGRWVPLEKFSAMGNGYTFELETLTFLALAYAAAWAYCLEGTPVGPSGLTSALDLIRNGDISVYGDDVIVPTELADDVLSLFKQCGFTVNLQKTYVDGEFRESCGGDYFRGQCVNTAKLSDSVMQPSDYFSIHNLLKKRFVDEYPCKPNAHKVLSEVKNHLPRRLRSMYGPTFLGDTVLHGWYGPHVRTAARTVVNLDHTISTDGNQWVASIEVLTPRVLYACIDDYSSSAQLANLLYSRRSEAPARRPTRTVKYQVTRYEGDYHIFFADSVPKAPWWLAQSPYARQLGILPSGHYVG